MVPSVWRQSTTVSAVSWKAQRVLQTGVNLDSRELGPQCSSVRQKTPAAKQREAEGDLRTRGSLELQAATAVRA